MDGCEIAFNVAGLNKFCVTDVTPMMEANVDGAVAAVRAAKQAGVPPLGPQLVGRDAGRGAGRGRQRVDDLNRGWYLSKYEESKTLGERAAMDAAAAIGQDVVYVNPSSVQGPGRAGGTGRFLIAFLDGRLKVFVDTYVSMVDIQDCVAGHLLAGERGEPGERYILNGIRLPSWICWNSPPVSLESRVRHAWHHGRWRPSVAPQLSSFSVSAASIRRSAGRWSGRSCTATVTTVHALT